MKKMNRKGFTIVELVIVIAVIAILAGVLIPTFSGLVGKAQDSAAIQEARNKYTEYVGLHDYSDGTSPAQNIVIEVDDQYVVVKDGKLQDKVYKDKENPADAKADAKAVAGADAAFICDECNDSTEDTDTKCDDCGKCVTHVWGTEDADKDTCTVCEAKCEHTYTEQSPNTCTTCGKAK